jgi:hypothetical protein
MVGRSRSHSEQRWALLPETIVRCNGTRPNGGRCKRAAEDGAVVCDQHGGAAPQVRRRAAEGLVMTADQAAQMLVRMMEDTEVPSGSARRSPKIYWTARVWWLRRYTRSFRRRRTRSCGSSRGIQRPEQLGVRPAARSDACHREQRDQQP